MTPITVLVALAGALVLASAAGVALLAETGGPATGQWVVAVVFTAIGARIADRHRRNPVGWLLLVTGVTGALGLFSSTYADAHPVVAWMEKWAWWPALGGIPLILLLFPDGTLPSRRWRLAFVTACVGLAAPTIALGAAAAIDVDVLSAPVQSPNALLVAARVGVLVAAVALLMGLAALVVRYRRAGLTERLQLKWLLVAGVVTLVASGLDVEWNLPGASLVAAAAIPVAVGVAILRYRLYSIDRIISRSVTYGLLSALLAGVYAGGATLLGQLVGRDGERSQLVVAASTLAVAALFGPARRRIQDAVDRRFNRRRHDARQLVEAFGARLRDELDLQTLEAELLRVVRDTMEPQRVSLSLRKF